MAKRFTETTKWEDGWFRKLPPRAKLFWFFILDRCDIAGFWEIDWELASFYIGEKVDESILQDFDGRIEKVNSNKLWVVKFIEFQYGTLNKKMNMHKKIIELLEKYNLLERVMEVLRKGKVRVKEGLVKGKVRVNEPLQEKDKEKDKDIYKEKDKEKENINNNLNNLEEKKKKRVGEDYKEEEEKKGKKEVEIILPEYINSELWNAYVEMRKKIKKPLTKYAIKLALNKLEKLRQEGEDPNQVLEQSILHCWQGLFPVKNKPLHQLTTKEIIDKQKLNSEKYKNLDVIKVEPDLEELKKLGIEIENKEEK